MEKTYVGIDVAKKALDIAVDPSGQVWSAANDDFGIGQVVADLEKLAPTLVVMEAIGGLELPLAAALALAGIQVAIVNPRQVRSASRAASAALARGMSCCTPSTSMTRRCEKQAKSTMYLPIGACRRKW